MSTTVGQPLVMSTLTTEFVEVGLTFRDDDPDPTGDVVAMAFIVGTANPAGGDWVTGSWRTGLSGKHYAQCLIGPGAAKQLPAGTYRVWMKFTDNPEAPARPVGQLTMR